MDLEAFRAAFKAGDKAYIVESNRIVRECIVKRVTGKLIIIRFEDGGGIQISENRLFDTQEAAAASIKSEKTISQELRGMDFIHPMIIGINKRARLVIAY